MGGRGFTLIEILVAIAICMVLTAIASIPYKELLRRNQTEAQTRAIHSELLRARITAVSEHKTIHFRFYPGRFFIYSSAESRDGVEPVLKKDLAFPVIWNVTGKLHADFEYDDRGVLDNNGSVCIDSDSTGAVDSIVLFKTRTSLGKRESGKRCNNDFITNY